MKKRALFILLALAVVISIVAFSACAGKEEPAPTPTEPTPTITPTLEPTPTPATIPEQVIIIKDFMFNPLETTIKAGNKVTWVNQDSARHTITGNGWDSGDLRRDELYSKSFDNPGIYDYTCAYHLYMKGKVIVE